MFCQFCGSRIPDGAIECPDCGSKMNSARHHNSSRYNGGRYSAKKPRHKGGYSFKKLFLIIAVVAAFAVFTFFICRTDNISTVKNGHLGVYTDKTVQEILEAYRWSYESEEWDSGKTNDDEELVQVKFSSPGKEPVTIQFTMLDRDTFKISAFEDPNVPEIFPTTNLFYLNFICITNQLVDIKDSPDKIDELLNTMKNTSASAVMYGASHDYSGNRAALHKLFNENESAFTVYDLFDLFGFAELNDLLNGSLLEGTSVSEPIETAPTLPPETVQTQPSDASNDIPPSEFLAYTADELLEDLDQNALRAERKYQDQYIQLTGKICGFDSDGSYFSLDGISYDGYSSSITCNITSEEQLNILLDKNEGDIITIQCKVTTIGESWSYSVDTLSIVGENHVPRTEHKVPASDYEQNNQKFGSVLRSAGEIRIRSGPSTSYEDIGRLKGGTPVTIYEQQQETSGRWWGRMDDGWVCMDYIVFGEDTSVAPNYAEEEISVNNNFVGIYGGKTGSVRLGYNESDSTYFAQIDIINLASMELTGFYDQERQRLNLWGTNVVILGEYATIDVSIYFDASAYNMTLVVDSSTHEYLPEGETLYFTKAPNE